MLAQHGAAEHYDLRGCIEDECVSGGLAGDATAEFTGLPTIDYFVPAMAKPEGAESADAAAGLSVRLYFFMRAGSGIACRSLRSALAPISKRSGWRN